MSHITKWAGLAVAAGAALLGPGARARGRPGHRHRSGHPRAGTGGDRSPRARRWGQPLQKGARLSELRRDRIRTGKSGAAEVVLGDGSLVRVGELSDLEIDKLDVDETGR